MPRHRTARHLAATFAAVPLVLAACGSGEPSVQQSDSFAPAIPASSLNLGLCIGVTPSDDPAQISAGLDQFAMALRQLPVPTSDQMSARSPVSGLNLVLRRVSSSPLSSPADELLTVQIPGVPGVSNAPDAADFQTFPERDAAWRQALADSDAAAAHHLAMREQALAALGTIDLNSDGSQIAGCLTALRDSFPRGARVTALVVSDLEQVGAPQLRGDFSTVDVIVAHACVDVARCDETAEAWRGVLASLGVPLSTFVSVGQLGSELTRVLEVSS